MKGYLRFHFASSLSDIRNLRLCLHSTGEGQRLEAAMPTLARMHGLGLGQILLQSGILLHRHGIAHIWLDAQQLQSFGTAV